MISSFLLLNLIHLAQQQDIDGSESEAIMNWEHGVDYGYGSPYTPHFVTPDTLHYDYHSPTTYPPERSHFEDGRYAHRQMKPRQVVHRRRSRRPSSARTHSSTSATTLNEILPFRTMDTATALDIDIEPHSGVPSTIEFEGNHGLPYIEIFPTDPDQLAKLEILPFPSRTRTTTIRTTPRPSTRYTTYNIDDPDIELIDARRRKGNHNRARNTTYEDNWGKKFPTCDGYAQSPINIHPNALYEENRLSLNFMNSYNSPLVEAELMNNGHTSQINYISGPRPALTGTSCFGDAFYFEQVHFHWGSKNTIGSEHAVFGQKFPLEMHLVHFNEKYGTLRDAADKPDGLAVLAVFFQISNQENPKFDSLIDSFEAIRCGGQSVRRDNVFRLSDFLPSNRRQFYRYKGSLTTPPCSESVTWIIFKHGLLIGRNQLKKFRELRQEDCKTPILNNWRNIQPSNGRRIERVLVSHFDPKEFSYSR
ncbi:Carbonic anhydrase 2 [Halotydeus destructor]|nr:Carbonic anhydrase 2 [Halotydeus destructor]